MGPNWGLKDEISHLCYIDLNLSFTIPPTSWKCNTKTALIVQERASCRNIFLFQTTCNLFFWLFWPTWGVQPVVKFTSPPGITSRLIELTFSSKVLSLRRPAEMKEWRVWALTATGRQCWLVTRRSIDCGVSPACAVLSHISPVHQW